jgi:hypothetical protein
VTNTVYTCASCSALNRASLEAILLLLCKNCGAVVYQNVNGSDKLEASRVPRDWSYLQLQTTGEYQQQPFTIVGRLRLQLRNDYKNFWCAALPAGKSFWIMESFASFSVFPPNWSVYNKEVSDLKAGEIIRLKEDLKVTGEYVEKCEEVGYEGEIASWKYFEPAFFFIQASNKDNQTAVFTIAGKQAIQYLTGEKVDVEKLNLKNTLHWDEWK